MTPLDRAHAAMEAAPEDTAARMGFYARVADAELVLVLNGPGAGDRVRPRLFETQETAFALVFDTELRAVEFCGDGVDYLSASGRQVARMLAGQGIGLAVNLGAPSATLLPPEALGWLVDTLDGVPEAGEARPVAVRPPGTVPAAVLQALDAKLSGMAGLARAAWLVEMDFDTRPGAHVLAFEGAVEAARPAMAAAVREGLVFSGVEAAALDVVFPDDGAPILAAVRRQGLRFDLPEPTSPRRGPGLDPDTPPKLR